MPFSAFIVKNVFFAATIAANFELFQFNALTFDISLLYNTKWILS